MQLMIYPVPAYPSRALLLALNYCKQAQLAFPTSLLVLLRTAQYVPTPVYYLMGGFFTAVEQLYRHPMVFMSRGATPLDRVFLSLLHGFLSFIVFQLF